MLKLVLGEKCGLNASVYDQMRRERLNRLIGLDPSSEPRLSSALSGRVRQMSAAAAEHSAA